MAIHAIVLPPYYQCTLHKLREEMVKYSTVSIISLSLIRMPASDNPYKSMRAIPYLKYRVILQIPPSGCISAGWGWPGAYLDNRPSTSQGCHKFHGRYGRNGATYTCDYHDPCWLLSPWLWYTMTINSHIIHWLLWLWCTIDQLVYLFTCLLFSFNVLISPAKFMHETAIISPPRYLPIDMPRALSIPTFGVHVQ